MRRASYPWHAAAELKGVHLFIHSFANFLSFSSIARVEIAVATNMSIWDSNDLGEISVKVSWALFGPALCKLPNTFLTQ